MTAPRPTQSWLGQTIGGRYKIEAMLGQGGMSAVYKATDPNLRRPVAIKLIHPHLSSDPEFVRRFEQEAAAVAQLRHPNIIQVYDFDHDGHVYFMVMEYVPGETLQYRLATLGAVNQRLPLPDTITVMAKICEAVDFAHEHGMVHRDLKPANVMLTPKGQPILMDFGVAKILGGTQHTATGAIIGTAKYMSPEQARGERPDARTDIYSLGVMLYEMVGGQPPFDADSTIAVLMKHVTQPVPDIRQLRRDTPEPLVAVIEKALEKKPQARYQTAAEMAAGLRAVNNPATQPAIQALAPNRQAVEGTLLDFTPSGQSVVSPPATPIPAPPPTFAPTPVSKSNRGMLWAAAAIVLVLGLLMTVGGIVWAARSVQTTAAQATPEPTAAVIPTESPVEVIGQEPTDTPLPPTPTPLPSPQASPTPAPVETATPPPSPASDTLPIAATAPPPTATRAAPPTPEPPPPPPNMVLIPAGIFAMGSTTGPADEGPEHPVSLRAFFMDKFEVSNADYRRCVADGGCSQTRSADAFTRPGYRDDPAFGNHPVVNVTWEQAEAYCRWDGKRLPTEAEWEYAAGGPENFTWPWGNNFNPAFSAAAAPDTEPVDSHAEGASPFGLFNMAGNVNEWVQDGYDAGFYAVSPAADPVNAGGDQRVFRGGSFANPDGAFYTTSRRYHNAPTFADVDVGFRCARNGNAS